MKMVNAKNLNMIIMRLQMIKFYCLTNTFYFQKPLQIVCKMEFLVLLLGSNAQVKILFINMWYKTYKIKNSLKIILHLVV